MDLIEYALDKYTDFKRFEQLSTEIMALEGYTTIRPVGGIDDEGIDAELVSYHKDDAFKTVFQYTIQENLSSKISNTIKKLEDNKIDYQLLIFVTKHQINNVSTLKRKARTEHSVNIEIFEKSTFIKHLSTENGIFARYFPDIKSQLKSRLIRGEAVFSSTDSKDPLEKSLLRSSLLFTFNTEADRSRKDVFDQTIFSLISTNADGYENGELIQLFREKFKKELSSGELEASIKRLKKDGYVESKKNKLRATTNAIEKLEGNLSRINGATKALISDIIANVRDTYGQRINSHQETLLQKNIEKSLSSFFCLYGLEYTDSARLVGNQYGFSDNQDLIEIAKKDLPTQLGDVLVYSIGEIIKKPTEEQAEVLANWAKAYIGVQIMGLDPKLRNIQVTELSKKTFILDTDFLLYTIVDHTPLSSIYRQIIKELQTLRCKIIIPFEVVLEAIKHAEFAGRNYNYFRNAFDAVDEVVVEEKIGNIYVKGYYNAVLSGAFDGTQVSFNDYLSNFYDANSPIKFLQEVIKNSIEGQFKFLEIAEISNESLDPTKLQELTDAIYDETNKTFKANYRSDDENKEVAETDAKLYLTLNNLNSKSERNSGEVFSGTHYLLTSSTRAIRCAWKQGYKHNVIAKPNTILSLLERLGKFHSTAKEIVNLFENPFLIEAVNNSWDDIKALIEAGISLKGKNVVRLKWDLDEEIKTFLNNQAELESQIDTSEESKVDSYIDFIRNFKSKGFKLIPETEMLLSKFEALEEEIAEKEITQEKLNEEIEKFGQRRQNYLNRVGKGGKKK